MKLVEEVVIKRLIIDLLDAGFSISVCDGEDITVSRATDLMSIFSAMCTTDKDYLLVHGAKRGQPVWVLLIYGNDGWDVINDYTLNLEPYMQGVNAFSDSLQDKC